MKQLQFSKSSNTGNTTTPVIPEGNATTTEYCIVFDRFMIYDTSRSTYEALLAYIHQREQFAHQRETYIRPVFNIEVHGGGGDMGIVYPMLRLICELRKKYNDSVTVTLYDAVSCGCYYSFFTFVDINNSFSIYQHVPSDSTARVAFRLSLESRMNRQLEKLFIEFMDLIDPIRLQTLQIICSEMITMHHFEDPRTFCDVASIYRSVKNAILGINSDRLSVETEDLKAFIIPLMYKEAVVVHAINRPNV